MSAIGKINFQHEPTERVKFSSVYSGWSPNIYQIVGEPYVSTQPFHPDPDTGEKIWDMPSQKIQKEIAQLFKKQWNLTSDAYNAGEVAMVGCTDDSNCCEWRNEFNQPFEVTVGASYPSEVADWNFGCAIVDGPTSDKHTIGNPFYPSNLFDFCGGLPPAGWWGGHTIYGCGDKGYTLWAFHPATAYNIICEQLDKKRWTWPKDALGPIPLPDNTGPLGVFP
jgi:hypothetical protein